MEEIAITDANIFIDLFELDLLPFLFDLKVSIQTTNEVLLECDEEQREYLNTFIKDELLTIHTMNDDQFQTMKNLSFSKRLSISDQTILTLAYNEKNMVLTGDKMIRKWCMLHKIEVHGILWVLDQFVNHEFLSPKGAIIQLNKLMMINSWLPVYEAEKLIKKWDESEFD